MLREFCESHGIEAELLPAPGAETAEGAAEALDTTVDSIVKSLVFMADRGPRADGADEDEDRVGERGWEPVLVVVTGPQQVSEEKLAAALGTDAVRMADPDEVGEATGYRIGGVPPVGTGLDKVVDERVLDQNVVYGGGGDAETVLKVDPRFIVGEDDLVRDVSV